MKSSICPIFSVIFISLLLPYNTTAQIVSFDTTYGFPGENWGYFVQQTFDEGYIIAGKTRIFGEGKDDVFLIKTDAYGDTMWTRTYGDSCDEWGYCVQQTADSGYVISALNRDSTDIFLIKTDKSGNSVWTRNYGIKGARQQLYIGRSVQQTSEEGFIIAGSIKIKQATGSWGDCYIIKTDATGDTMWTRTYGRIYRDWCTSVQQTNDGGFICTGANFDFDNCNDDVCLIKWDKNGNFLWAKTFGYPHVDKGHHVSQTSDGGYIITGETDISGTGNYDVYLIKTNANGDAIWTRTYGDSGKDCGYSVQPTSDGGYIIVGMTEYSKKDTSDIYLLKTYASGDTMWVRTYAGENDDIGYSVQETLDGGYIITGETKSSAMGVKDIRLIKTRPNGKVRVMKEFSNKIPSNYQLSQNYPNPFNSETTIKYELPHHCDVSINIFNINGQLVQKLIEEKQAPGYYVIAWNGKHLNGQPLPSGIYFYQLQTKDFMITKKMVLVR